MLNAYFDESGGQDTGLFLIGGFIAPEVEWEKIGRKWRAVLDAYEAPAFHAVELAQGRKAFGDRSLWPRERREALARDLVMTLADFGPAPLAAAIDVSIFERMVPRKLLRELQLDPYIVGFLYVAGIAVTTAAPDLRANVWYAEHPSYGKGRLRALHEGLQGLGGSLLVQAASREHFGTFTLASPASVLLLQVADMFVYAFSRYMRVRRLGGAENLWSVLGKHLKPRGIGFGGLLTEDHVRAFLQNERLLGSYRDLLRKRRRI